ncbi:phosphoribosylanthranilate isomerase [Neobacillus sp. MM2021_6]|uniref:phosphoribosylanthranilate isomerase n=1 Tax=Bacillaceae TaxID=186817 RepID=UPI00140A53EF|nr:MULTISPECIES: phosphoribosylanthranilate isomerase [Bacillaceae]MBO0958356.1 phosphoribosylanthranilate isomerase [Neobacillus sp. MM2021_6]NHC17956.1 phosphoribosylanthranilate isomerase [Bacillus sp. MM2020_4]
MKVKICGITDVKTALATAEYGADAIGFVFADSKRRISIEKATEIVSALPNDVYKVGVFVNETQEEVERIASVVGLTHIQLHGDEPASFCELLSLPVIKAISFDGNEGLADISQFPAEYILLDGPKEKYRGGNGTAFDWNEVNAAILSEKRVILAGGLHLNNVELAINIVKPAMVDVSSGVESDGVKDLVKIKEFITKVKNLGGNENEHIYITK